MYNHTKTCEHDKTKKLVIHSIKRIESFLDVSSDHLTPNDPSFSTLTPLCPLLLGMFPLLLLPTLLNYVFMWDHNDMQHPPTRSLGFPIRLIGVIREEAFLLHHDDVFLRKMKEIIYFTHNLN